MRKKRVQPEIAIIGISTILPGAHDYQTFWHNIKTGKDFIKEIPPSHWLTKDYYAQDSNDKSKVYTNKGAFVDDVNFDPMLFGIPPNVLASTDTVQLLALIAAHKVLHDAVNLQFNKVSKDRTSVILGVAAGTELMVQMSGKIQAPIWSKVLRANGLSEEHIARINADIAANYTVWNEDVFPGLLSNVVAGRIANSFDLGGTNCVVDAACASSLAALKMAIAELQSDESDMVITGGADALNDIFMYMCFSRTPALSPTGDCRPFSAKADGTMLGEGVGLIALKKLENAERDGDQIFAVIRGIGSSSDGKAKSIYAPLSDGQAIAINRTYNGLDYSPVDIELMEAHGTGTKAGDSAEFNGLRIGFGCDGTNNRKQYCALGSIKSQIGHAKGAAGIASLIKATLALHNKVLPPSIKIDEPNPNLNVQESPFYLNSIARPWIHHPKTTRKAAVSSFGFGGSNYHITLEEYRPPSEITARKQFPDLANALLMLGSETIQELIDTLAMLNKTVHSWQALLIHARNSQLQFAVRAKYRLALLFTELADFEKVIDTVRLHLQQTPEQELVVPAKIYYFAKNFAKDGKVALVFPGQGSQYLNMGAELIMNFGEARTVWDSFADSRFDKDLELHEVVYPIPKFTESEKKADEKHLTQTEWSQPAIGAVCLSQLRLLNLVEVKPDCVAGHSYGELVALYAAGVIDSPEDLIAISRKRGELMANASTEAGAMLAVLASQEEVAAYIKQVNNSVILCNINSPKQVVVGGKSEEIDAFANFLQEKNITCSRLNVSTAFHSPFVAGIVKTFNEYLNTVDFQEPKLPIYSNTTAKLYIKKPQQIRNTLAKQLANPVLFEAQIRQMYLDGVRVFIEVGPNNVLTSLIKQILADKKDYLVVALDKKNSDGLTLFWNGLAQLAAAGQAINFANLWSACALFPSEQYNISYSKATVKINGANFNKPYPPKETVNSKNNHQITGGVATLLEPTVEKIANQSNPHVIPNQSMTKEYPTMTNNILHNNSAVNHQDQNTEAKMEIQKETKFAVNSSALQTKELESNDWLVAFQAVQQTALAAHRSFQEALMQSHQQFLSLSESMLQQLTGRNTSSELDSRISYPHTRIEASVTQSRQEISMPEIFTTASHKFSPIVESMPHIEVAPVARNGHIAGNGFEDKIYASEIPPFQPHFTAPHHDIETQVTQQPVNFVPPVSEQGNISFSADTIQTTVFKVIAEKTGYPEEMLEVDMELEAGLGIDSIKRVEILSLLQEHYPILRQADTARLTELQTLKEIIDFAQNFAGENKEVAAFQQFNEPVSEKKKPLGTF